MIYLFSNAHSYGTDREFANKILNKFRPKVQRDTAVFLNTCKPLEAASSIFRELKKNGLSIYSILRGMNLCKQTGYWGFEYCARNSTLFDYIILLNLSRFENLTSVEELNPKLKTQNSLLKDINFGYLKNYPGYESGEYPSPTTGYLAYHLLKQLYPHEPITLVNFYGKSNNSTPKYKDHNWEYEDKFFKENDKIRTFI